MFARDVIFVLGTPRSGTSALARVLSLCGGTLPTSVLAPRELNPKGFWEPVEAVQLNHEFLFRHHRASIDQVVKLHLNIDCDESEREEFIGKIQAFLAACPHGPVLIIKENDIPVFMGVWTEAARREKFSAKMVISVRDPREVLASWSAWGKTGAVDLASIDTTDLEAISLILLARNLIIERASRGIPRVFVSYSNLLEDWKGQVVRMSRALSVEFMADESAIGKFLTNDLHRQRASSPMPHLFCGSWISRVYAVFSAAANDEPIDMSTLDEIGEAFRACERVAQLLSKFSEDVNVGQVLEEISQWPVWNSGSEF